MLQLTLQLLTINSLIKKYIYSNFIPNIYLFNYKLNL